MERDIFRVSCVPLVSEEDDSAIVLCKTRFSAERCNNLEELQSLKIEELVASEGSEIMAAENIDCQQLRCFSSADPLNSWYELICLLSADAFEMDIDRSWTENAKWNFYYVDNVWKLAFEARYRGFTRKFCELEVVPAREKEVDLFTLSLKLYQDYKQANAQIHALKRESASLEQRIVDLKNSQAANDARIQARDESTRSMIINLLNEKKSMIRKLQKCLEQKQPPGDVPDEFLLNKFVNEPASRMASPRKRATLGKSTPSPVKKAKKDVVKDEEFEQPWAEANQHDFQFCGINRERSSSAQIESDVRAKPATDPFIDDDDKVFDIEANIRPRSTDPQVTTTSSDGAPLMKDEDSPAVKLTPDESTSISPETEVESDEETEAETEAESNPSNTDEG